jgi:hypothetical protein
MAYLDNGRIASFIDEGIAHLEEEIAFRQSEADALDDTLLPSLKGPARNRYMELWNRYRQLMLEEGKSRLAWLRSLKEEYGQEKEV